MRVILEFEGNDIDRFEKAISETDENFDFYDNLFWELDYGDGESKHCSKYGDITIKTEGVEKNLI